MRKRKVIKLLGAPDNEKLGQSRRESKELGWKWVMEIERRAFEGKRSQLSHVLMRGQVKCIMELSTGFGYLECGDIIMVSFN